MGTDNNGIRMYESDFSHESDRQSIDGFKQEFEDIFNNEKPEVTIVNNGNQLSLRINKEGIDEHLRKYMNMYKDRRNIVRGQFRTDIADILQTARNTSTKDWRGGIEPRHPDVDFCHMFKNTVKLGDTYYDFIFTVFEKKNINQLYFTEVQYNKKLNKKSTGLLLNNSTPSHQGITSGTSNVTNIPPSPPPVNTKSSKSFGAGLSCQDICYTFEKYSDTT